MYRVNFALLDGNSRVAASGLSFEGACQEAVRLKDQYPLVHFWIDNPSRADVDNECGLTDEEREALPF